MEVFLTMKLWDNHMHCHFSGDSKANPVDMVNHAKQCGLAGITFTDHLDLDYLEEPGLFDLDLTSYEEQIHLLSEKEGGCLKAASGGPLVQHSLQMMLELACRGVFSKEFVVEKMCHAPAQIYNISKRGYIREGYQADLVLVRREEEPWTLTADKILSKCGWSPLEGKSFHWKVEKTFVNGQAVYTDGHTDEDYRGQMLIFER